MNGHRMFLLLHFDSDELSSGLPNLDLKSFLDDILEVFHCTLFTNKDNVIYVEKQNQSKDNDCSRVGE